MRMNRWLVMAGVAAGLSLGLNQGLAQNNGGGGGGGQGGGGGGFGRFRNMSPEERQQMMMDRVKQDLEVSDDAEWKVIQPLVQKVMDARMAQMSMGGGGRMFGFGQRNRGGDNQGGDQGGQRQRGGFFGQQSSPEADALQKAIDAKAPKAEVKAALAKLVEARKAKQADLEKAQEDLRKVLTSRQEAIAVLNGWL